MRTSRKPIIYFVVVGGRDTRILKRIERKLEIMNESQEQFAADLAELTTTVAKIADESTATLQKVKDLEAALDAAGQVSPEVQSAFDALKEQVQKTDDLVADAPVVEPPPAPEPEPIPEDEV